MIKNTEKEILLLPLFQQFMNASASGRRVTASGKQISKGTIIQYRCIYKLLEEFETTVTKTPVRIKLIHRTSMRELHREKLYWQRFFRHFRGWLCHEKKYYDQYMGSIAKVLRTFFNYLLNEKCLLLQAITIAGVI